MTEEDKPIDVKELAARWRCSEQTVRTRWKEWGLPGFRIGRRLFFYPQDVRDAEQRAVERQAESA